MARMYLTWGGAVVLLALWQGTTAAQESPSSSGRGLQAASARVASLVGDADGNGLFNSEDARYLRYSLSRRGTVLQTDGSLADVAEPCDRLDELDLDLIVAALRARTAGYPIESECHLQAIGTPLGEHPDEATSPPLTLDDQFAKVAESVQEFGGFYFEDGTLRIVLTDTSPQTLERAVRAVVLVFGEDLQAPEEIEPVAGEYRFTELREWKGRARQLLSTDEMTSLDIDEVRNRVTVGLANIEDRDVIEAQLDALGVPTEALFFKERPIFELQNHQLVPNLRSTVRPLRGGLEIGGVQPGFSTGSGCTLGFTAMASGSLVGFVTNEHCTGAAGSIGAVFSQPASVNGGTRVGVETKDAAVFTDAQDSACPDDCTCRWSDAAFVTLDPGITAKVGLTSKSEHFWPYNMATPVLSEGPPAVCGQWVYRVGRSTGQAAGEVTETCCDVDADWSTVGNSPALMTLLCQNMVEAEHQSGDSGSPVFGRGSVTWGLLSVRLFGISWGSLDDEYVYSPMANIEAELGSLSTTEHNEKPLITILEPAQDSEVGSGAFPTVSARASFFDLEDGTCASGCEMKWIDTLDGLLGVSQTVDGEATLEFMLSGAGARLLIAVGKDMDGATGVDWVQYSSGNSAPQVWIEWPPGNETVYAGVTYLVQGDSFDNELFHALPCSSLNWSLGASSSPSSAVGCSAQVVFSQLGQQTITLTGADSGAKSDMDSVNVNVVAAPLNAGPSVTFLVPDQGSGLDRDAQAVLVGKANDPDDAGPITFDWVVTGGLLVGGVPETTFDTSSAADNAPTSVKWTPSDDTVSSCGAAPYRIELRATDADGQTGVGFLDIFVMSPAC